jgi:hypothetical protein
MSTPQLRAFYARAFLHPASRRYALMLPSEEARRRGRKYDERCGSITAGKIALAAAEALRRLNGRD